MASAGDDRSRPGQDGFEKVEQQQNISMISVVTDTSGRDSLTECTGLDDPRFRAAVMVADAWQPALNCSWQMGYEQGYAEGVCAAEKEMADAWLRMYIDVRKTLKQPTFAELQRRREVA